MEARLAALARRQYGVIAHHQALEHGMTAAAMRRRLATGEWRREQPRVYAATTSRIEDRGRLYAVWLSLGPPMALTGIAAGQLYRLAELPALTRIDLALPVARSADGLAGVRLRHPDALPPVVAVERLPVLPLAEVLVDLAANVPEPAAMAIVQEVLREDRCDERAIRAVLRRGRAGSAAMRRVLGVVGDGADSYWERRLWRACAAAGLPKPTRPWLVSPRTGRRMRPDGLVDGVVVEVDGWAAHKSSRAFVEDRRRRNAIAIDLGLDQLHFTPVDLRDRMADCVAEIELMVRARRGRRAG